MMVGRYEIEITNNRVTFFLEIKRNITIIQGDSATGKTTLIRMLSEYNRLGMREIRDSQKYIKPKHVYNELYRLYNLSDSEKIDPEIVYTEDSNSGFDCFSRIFGEKCRSLGGKSLASTSILNMKPIDANHDANRDANEANLEANGQELDKKIHEKVESNPHITQKELADLLDVSRSTVQRAMDDLKAQKRLERVDGTRGYWEVEHYIIR